MKNNRLLSAVGVAALTIASQSAFASVDSASDFSGFDGGSVRIAEGSGLVVEFVSRIGGAVTPDSIRDSLFGMFPALSLDQAEKLPALMLNIRSLGWSKSLEAAAGDAMVDLLVGAQALADESDAQIRIATMIGVSGKMPVMPVRVAQTGARDGLCLYRPTDARRRLDPDCPPLATGALGGGGGSTGSGGGY